MTMARGRHDGKSVREAIFAAALALAAEHGITGTTMDDIAARAGVAKGSLYYNFASKDQLFADLLDEALSTLSDRLKAARRGRTGLEAVRALFETILQAMQESPDLARVLVAEIFRNDRSWVQTVDAHREQFLSELQHSCEEAAAAAGHQLPHPDIVAAGLFGAALTVGLEWRLTGVKVPRGQAVDSALDGLGTVLSAPAD